MAAAFATVVKSDAQSSWRLQRTYDRSKAKLFHRAYLAEQGVVYYNAQDLVNMV